jgi:hypothetical protein
MEATGRGWSAPMGSSSGAPYPPAGLNPMSGVVISRRTRRVEGAGERAPSDGGRTVRSRALLAQLRVARAISLVGGAVTPQRMLTG